MQAVGQTSNVGTLHVEAGANHQAAGVEDNPITETAGLLWAGLKGGAVGAVVGVLFSGAVKLGDVILHKGNSELPTKTLFAASTVGLSLVGAAIAIKFYASRT